MSGNQRYYLQHIRDALLRIDSYVAGQLEYGGVCVLSTYIVQHELSRSLART